MPPVDQNRMAEDFRTHAASHGLRPELLGRHFRWVSARLVLVGFDPQEAKEPFVARDEATGCLFYFDAHDVLNGLLPEQSAGEPVSADHELPALQAPVVELAGVTLHTHNGDHVSVASLRAALSPLHFLAVAGKLAEHGVPLLDSGVRVDVLRPAMEHVANLVRPGPGAWARDLARAYASCGDTRHAAGGLARELNAVLEIGTESAERVAWRLIRACGLEAPGPPEGCVDGKPVDLGALQAWTCPVHPGFETESESDPAHHGTYTYVCWGYRAPRDRATR